MKGSYTMTDTVTTPVLKNPVRRFVADLTERALKTGAQTALVAFGGDSMNLWHVPWHNAAGIVGGAVLASVLTSLASVSVGNSDSASLVR